VRIVMGYPTAKDEAAMLRAYGTDPPVPQPVLAASDVIALQAMVERVHIEPDLLDYAVSLTHYTRSHPKVTLGCSPRATLGLVQASKAFALMGGRPFVTPDDFRAVAPSVLAHRLLLNGDTESDAAARSQIIDEALSRVSYRRAARPL